MRVFTFDQQLTETGDDVGKASFKGDRSNLLGALRQVEERFRGQPLAAVLVLSDGLDTIASTKALESAGANVPVFTFELEKPFKLKPKAKRVSIANVDYPQRVVIGWESEIHVVLNGTGKGNNFEHRRNGNYFLRQQEPGQTVFDDNTRDDFYVWGHDNWLLTGRGKKFVDDITGQDTPILTGQMEASVRRICVEVINEFSGRQTAAQPKVVVLQSGELLSERVGDDAAVPSDKQP